MLRMRTTLDRRQRREGALLPNLGLTRTDESLLFLAPRFIEKPWGGFRIARMYGGAPLGGIGECVAASGHRGTDSFVRHGCHAGRTLSSLWAERRDLFGDIAGEEFPLQIKLLDAFDDLSIQVHPDEEYARAVEGQGAKNEAWYVMYAKAGQRVGMGHNAADKAEFDELARSGRWGELVRTVEMRKGDYFDIPAGTAHCLLAGSAVYEILQPSDITYRLYDYDRLDERGRLRSLQLDRGLDVLKTPDTPVASPVRVEEIPGATITRFPRNEHFSLRKWEVADHAGFAMDAPFLIASVLEGHGVVNGAPVSTGDHFVVTAVVRSLEVRGSLTMMVASV